MVPTTIRLPDDLHVKITAAASESGVNVNAFVVAILEAAIRRGWRVEKRPGVELVEPR